MNTLTRRGFLSASAAVAVSSALPVSAQGPSQRQRPKPDAKQSRNVPIVISSGNGLRSTTKAIGMIRTGADPLDAIVEGVRIVEDDPNDMTVGLGGLPNEEGVVELDSSVMHGPTHRAGAVAALRNIKNPAAVARDVARRTDHVLLVGDGALKFARRIGYTEENLLTEEARLAWLRWRARLNRDDDWLQEDEFDLPARSNTGRQSRADQKPIPFTYGTIHCSAVTPAGDLAGVTTTSGLSWKLPGRVGDSPIIGAGLYTDNEVGSAGATGRGEAVIQVCGARTAVMRMEMGDTPTEACLYVLKLIASKTKLKRLLNAAGEPNFNVVMYAVRKDGVYGSACMRGERQFAVSDERGDRLEECAFLFPER